MAEIKLRKKLIYAGDAHRAILEADPKLVYCIEQIKGVDAVEVVRCKDCKNFTCTHIDRGVCELEREAHGTSCCWYINDFCSYGERKEGE